MTTPFDMAHENSPLSSDELEAEGATALPAKEVLSLLDLNADIDLALDVAAPIDLAIAANANVAAPIDAAVAANVLSFGSEAQAMADQGVLIDQSITGDAAADATQDSSIDQSNDVIEDGSTTTPAADDTTIPVADDTTTPVADDTTIPVVDDTMTTGGILEGDLLDIDINLAADLDLAAPINGAVAVNANVAAPIDAAVAANILSIDSDAAALAEQDALITQSIEGDATASADQDSEIDQ